MTQPPPPSEAAQRTQQLLDPGCTKRRVGRTIGPDPSPVSQF